MNDLFDQPLFTEAEWLILWKTGNLPQVAVSVWDFKARVVLVKPIAKSKGSYVFKCDVIIEKNSMNSEHTNIIVNTASKRAKEFDINKLVAGKTIIFKHPTGFITVVGQKVEEFISEEKFKFKQLLEG